VGEGEEGERGVCGGNRTPFEASQQAATPNSFAEGTERKKENRQTQTRDGGGGQGPHLHEHRILEGRSGGQVRLSCS